jgi:short-subunit dehydrogenase
MTKRGFGKILNVSSIAAFQPGPFMSIYYASKAFVLSFSQAIANELKDTGVTVTALCPGPTRTSFQDMVSLDAPKNKISFNMSCPKAVAKYGYDAMLKGKTVAIPGLFNRFLAFLPRIIPRNLATSIVRRIQLKNRLAH